MFHYRKNYKIYKSFPKPVGCSFCEDDLSARAIRTTNHVVIVPNRVSYDLWEMREVIEHLLVVPLRHVDGLGDLEPEAMLEIMQICGEYEKLGYNIYARAQGNGSRSVQHQHTHLIKTKPNRARGTLALTKPHILVKI